LRILAIVLIGKDGLEMWKGKPKAAWTFLQAASSRYVHETWTIWSGGQVHGPDFLGDLEGDPVKFVITEANKQKKDGVDIVAVLDAGQPVRNVDDIDKCLDTWLECQDKRVHATFDSIVVDSASKWLSDVIPVAVEYKLDTTIDVPPMAYYEYIKRCLTETGYVQHSGKYNSQVATGKLPWEYRFSFFNHYTIFQEMAEGRAADVAKAKQEVPVPALVIGSGSSLDDALPLLKDWKGPIVASSAQASSILYHGFTGPLYIMVFDIWTRVDELNWMGDVTGKDITLISHPGVNPELLAAWKGKKLYYRCMDLNNMFFSEILPKAYDSINTSMLLFASSAAAQMSIANCLNFSPLFLVGIDFSLVRFKKWIWDASIVEGHVEGEVTGSHMAEDGIKVIDKMDFNSATIEHGKWVCKPDVDPIAAKPIKANNGVWTDPLQVFYKLSALTVWRIDHCQCINTSRKSIVSEMPYADLQQVIAGQGRGFEDRYISPQEIEDRVELYLAKKNNFIVRFKRGGVRAVESGSTDPDGWRRDLGAYMANANIFTFHKEGEEAIDTVENMKRFEWLKENLK
jgi:hypothetical protein